MENKGAFLKEFDKKSGIAIMALALPAMIENILQGYLVKTPK